jgi:polyisoprenyl-phosphate glycosyltransferase
MIRLALDGITSFSNAPLQTAFLAGIVTAALSVAYGIYIVVREIFFGFPVQGWSSIMVAILFLGSTQLITIGVLGEYVGRIYDEVKKRPKFVFDFQSSRGIENEGSPAGFESSNSAGAVLGKSIT